MSDSLLNVGFPLPMSRENGLEEEYEQDIVESESEGDTKDIEQESVKGFEDDSDQFSSSEENLDVAPLQQHAKRKRKDSDAVITLPLLKGYLSSLSHIQPTPGPTTVIPTASAATCGLEQALKKPKLCPTLEIDFQSPEFAHYELQVPSSPASDFEKKADFFLPTGSDSSDSESEADSDSEREDEDEDEDEDDKVDQNTLAFIEVMKETHLANKQVTQELYRQVSSISKALSGADPSLAHMVDAMKESIIAQLSEASRKIRSLESQHPTLSNQILARCDRRDEKIEELEEKVAQLEGQVKQSSEVILTLSNKMSDLEKHLQTK